MAALEAREDQGNGAHDPAGTGTPYAQEMGGTASPPLRSTFRKEALDLLRRAEASLSPAPTKAVGSRSLSTSEVKRRRDWPRGLAGGKTPRPARGAPRAEEPPGQASSPGTDDGGIRQRSHGIPEGGKPHLPMDAGHPGKTEAQTGVDAKASVGVFGCLPPCLQPGLLGVHLGGGYQEKGRRPWPRHA